MTLPIFPKPLSGNEPVNEDLDTYYKNWCEQEHQPPYVYENTNEQSPAYGMKYYKTEEDKTAGKPAARALYHDAKNVEVESTDDKGPDYEFWMHWSARPLWTVSRELFSKTA